MYPISVVTGHRRSPSGDRRSSAAARLRLLSSILVGLASCLVLMSCAGDGLLFKQDHRLTITSPEDRSTSDIPVRVAWSVDDFTVSQANDPVVDDEGYFVVFVDRAPIGKGDRLDEIGQDDPQCRAEPNCPDEEYLAQLDIYPTRSNEVTLTSFRVLGGDQPLHTAWVVLVDSEGRRTGEAQWKVTFDVRLPGEVG